MACKKHQVIWSWELPKHPSHQPNGDSLCTNRIRALVTTLTMFGVCTLQDFPAAQGLPSELLFYGLLCKMWKDLAWWFKSQMPTDSHLKWGKYCNCNYNYQVIRRCEDSCCTGEGGFLGPKCSTHHCCLKLMAIAASWKTNQQELKNMGLIWLQHQETLYTFIKSIICRSNQQAA